MKIQVWGIVCIVFIMVYTVAVRAEDIGYPFAPVGGQQQTPATNPHNAPGAQGAAGPPKPMSQKQSVEGPKNPLDLPLVQNPHSHPPVGERPNPAGAGMDVPQWSAGGASGKTAAKAVRPKVDFELGVQKNAPVTGRALPPVGKLPNGLQSVEPTVIHAMDGVVYEVQISRWMPNRFATPFRSPKVVDSSGAQIQTVNGDVFVLPADENPFVVYIVEGNPSPGVKASTISLLMLPKEQLPAQNVVLMYGNGGESNAWRGGSSDTPYVKHIKQIYRELVRGNTPTGFTRMPMEGKPIAVMGDTVQFSPVEYYAGSGNLMVIVYSLKNIGNEVVDLNEESFYRDGVRAVALYPDTVILPGKETRLYVLVSGK